MYSSGHSTLVDCLQSWRDAEIKSDWPSAVVSEWLPKAGLEQSHHYIIEAYDPVRFKGLEDPASELDIYVPIR